MLREKGDHGSSRPPFRPFVDESGPRPDKPTYGSLVTKRAGECPGGGWNLRIISQAIASRNRETMLLLAPRSSHCRVTADETRSQLDELLPGMVSVTGRARGLKVTGNLLKMQQCCQSAEKTPNMRSKSEWDYKMRSYNSALSTIRNATQIL